MAQQDLRPEDAVGVEPVHYAAAALLTDDGRQVVGRDAEIIRIGLDIPGKRVLPAQGVQELLEDALSTAEFGGILTGLMGVQQLEIVQEGRFQVLHRLPVIGPVDNLPQEVDIMPDAIEIIGLQAQPGALFKVDGQAAEGQHLPVVIFGNRGDTDIVVLWDNEHVSRLSLIRHQVDVMCRFPCSHQYYPAKFHILGGM